MCDRLSERSYESMSNILFIKYQSMSYRLSKSLCGRMCDMLNERSCEIMSYESGKRMCESVSDRLNDRLESIKYWDPDEGF